MNLLFDLDGTLTDPYEGITKCISYALVSLGRQAPPRIELKWCIGPPLKNSFATLLDLKGRDNSLAEEALLLYRERFSQIGLYENQVFEGIPEMLEKLIGSGHHLYVATAKPTIFANKILKHFKLDHYFIGVYGSELDGTRCDKTSLIAYILKKEALKDSNTQMIGDRKHDIIGAYNNGIKSIGVSWGYGTSDELQVSGANTCVDTPQELVTLLNED